MTLWIEVKTRMWKMIDCYLLARLSLLGCLATHHPGPPNPSQSGKSDVTFQRIPNCATNEASAATQMWHFENTLMDTQRSLFREVESTLGCSFPGTLGTGRGTDRWTDLGSSVALAVY